jgi:type VI protein secretion system component VasF
LFGHIAGGESAASRRIGQAMDSEPDTPDREKPPSPEILRTRQQLSQSRFGRWGRLRSWATVLVGVLALALLFLLMDQTD